MPESVKIAGQAAVLLMTFAASVFEVSYKRVPARLIVGALASWAVFVVLGGRASVIESLIGATITVALSSALVYAGAIEPRDSLLFASVGAFLGGLRGPLVQSGSLMLTIGFVLAIDLLEGRLAEQVRRNIEGARGTVSPECARYRGPRCVPLSPFILAATLVVIVVDWWLG